MDCSELARLLSEHPLSELTEEQRADAAAHLDTCEQCWVKWDLEDDSQDLHQLEEAYPPFETFRDAVMSRLSGGTTALQPSSLEEEEVHPEKIGGFEILCPLGKGGMGTVYKARQVSMERVVALKLLPKRLEKDAGYVARFFREARAAAKLRNLNIVQAYDVGQADGRYYFAMEYVDGDDLRFMLRCDGPLAPGRALKYMKQTCRALAAAHKHGIIHRDIKPSNLVIDSEDSVRVADFGLAKRLEDDVSLTADGQALGTPAYVAPELASGKPIDGRSDLYSLGATFFRLLSGRPVFHGSSFAEVVVKHVNDAPPLLQEAAPHVDRRLCGIIDRLLAKDPRDRFESAEALLDALDALGELASADESSHIDSTIVTPVGREAPARRRRWYPVAVVAAAVVGAILLGVFFPRGSGTEPSVKNGTPQKPEAAALSMFDGVTLNGWKPLERVEMYPGEHGTGVCGRVWVEGKAIVLEAGDPFTVLRWSGEFPRINYEVSLEVMRREGDECFCNIFFPVGAGRCSLTMGGWQMDLTGLDAVNGLDPRRNGTGKVVLFPQGEWVPVLLQVTESAIRVTVRDEQVIDLPVPGHTFTVDDRWESLKPFSLVSSWSTAGAARTLVMRELAGSEPGLIVLARDEWRDSGQDLVEGRSYTLTATGRWGTAPEISHGPEGDGTVGTSLLPLPDAPAFSLIGRIGVDGPPFPIGESTTLTADRSGRLFVQMNDERFEDNVGSVRVRIKEVED